MNWEHHAGGRGGHAHRGSTASAEFNVIVTENMFGDILTDEAARCWSARMGMLPSASHRRSASGGLYEPIHGSAPDLAGQDRANPVGAILSVAMMLRHSLDTPEAAAAVEDAVAAVLAAGVRTMELVGTGAAVGTAAFGDAVLAELGEAVPWQRLERCLRG